MPLTLHLHPGAAAADLRIAADAERVGAGGLAHVIAGSADVLYLVFRGELPWLDYVGRFFIPTLIGNTVGGTLLVAGLNHAQVVGGRDEDETRRALPGKRFNGQRV